VVTFQCGIIKSILTQLDSDFMSCSESASPRGLDMVTGKAIEWRGKKEAGGPMTEPKPEAL